MIKVSLLAVLFGAISFVSCKKDDDKSGKDLLTDATCWKLSKSEVKDPTTGAWTSETIDDCDADDCVKFSADGTASFDEGASKCDPSDPQTSGGAWTLSSDEKTLTLDDPDLGEIPFIVEELSANKLVIRANLIFVEIRTTFTN